MASGPCPSTLQVSAVVSALLTWSRRASSGEHWRPVTHVPLLCRIWFCTWHLRLRQPGPWVTTPGLHPCRPSSSPSQSRVLQRSDPLGQWRADSEVTHFRGIGLGTEDWGQRPRFCQLGTGQATKLSMGPLHPHSSGRSPKVCRPGVDPRRLGCHSGPFPTLTPPALSPRGPARTCS